jgi:transcriptional regulator with XRE-family HTH domain
MSTKNPRMGLPEKKVDEPGLRREIEELVRIEHKIANLRKNRGLTQAALAKHSGVSQSRVAKIESGRLKNLTLKTLARTARALGANIKIELVPHAESDGHK